jgi:hypothetical protein
MDYRDLSRSKNEQRRVAEVLHSTVQEQHLALEMTSSERLTPKMRERAPAQNNKEAKP